MDANLIEIVCRAATITARSGPDFIPEQAGPPAEGVISRLEQWCQIVADGDWPRFERRLSLDGLTLETARRALLPVRISPGAKLPTWVETLAAVLSAAEESGSAATDRCLEAGAPFPFEDVCLPFVRVAQTHLRDRSGSAYQLLNDAAHGALERHLLARLSALSAQALYLEFSIFRGWQRSGLARFLFSPSPQPSKQMYADFVRELLGGTLVALFREYSVLARRMATTLEVWVDATAELLLRLKHDSPALAAAFGSGGEMGRVTGIQPGLSDPHGGGRSVAVLEWDSGLKLAYKPRNLSLEAAYNRLLHWLNAHGAPLSLRVCRILERPTYGWMEFVDHLPCTSLQDAENYFRRAGMQLCLVYALRGTDLHEQNVIASRDQPVLVDLEVLLQPRLRESVPQLTGSDDPARRELAESVLATGMLPWWLLMPDGRTWNLAGLGAGEEAEYMFRVPTWRNVNSDAMELTYEYTTVGPQANVARLEDEPLSPVRFEEQLVDGFQCMYRILLDRRDALLAPGGVLSSFAHVPVRFLLRATNLYAWYVQRGLGPQFLREGIVASLLIDALSRELVRTPDLWPAFDMETQSLERMDIPWFATRSDSDSLLLGTDHAVEHCFFEPGYELVVKRIGRMSEDDLAWQIQMICGALQAYGADGVAQHLPADRATTRDRDGDTTFTPEEAVRQALALAQGLERRALRSESGAASWIGVVPIPLTHRMQLQPIWYGLYDGACGIALFLAALEKITNGAGYRDLCLAALQPLRAALQARRDEAPPYIGPHGELGLVIYGLARISGLLGEPALLEDARRLALYATHQRITSDRKFDVLSGNAGMVLALLTLYQATGDDEFLGRAIACGRHLLEHQVASAAGLRSWRTLDGQMFAGFSHGAAGIAYALLRVGRAADEAVFSNAALEAIAYEQSLFDQSEENWPRLSVSTEGRSFPCSWCHGASGIGLARVASLDIADTPAIREDIDAALRTTQRVGLQGVDHLCCGNFGRLEFLLSAGQRLGRGELVALARRQAGDVVARATARGRYVLRGSDRDLSADLSPGLFQGEAGIGYELLRLAYPEQVPSVLSFE